MGPTYYRTDRTIHISAPSERILEVRTYGRASSASEERVSSRPVALGAIAQQGLPSIVGLETVIDVPGVTTARPPEVLIHGKWMRVYLPTSSEA